MRKEVFEIAKAVEGIKTQNSLAAGSRTNFSDINLFANTYGSMKNRIVAIFSAAVCNLGAANF